MTISRYQYTHNHKTGILLIGNDDESYLFQVEDGNVYLLSRDDDHCSRYSRSRLSGPVGCLI